MSSNVYKYNIVVRSPRFNREMKKAQKRGLNPEEVEAVIDLLKRDTPLPSKYHDYLLHGEYKGHRECHINPDWLLIYKKVKDELTLYLVRTGTHSDLFS